MNAHRFLRFRIVRTQAPALLYSTAQDEDRVRVFLLSGASAKWVVTWVGGGCTTGNGLS